MLGGVEKAFQFGRFRWRGKLSRWSCECLGFGILKFSKGLSKNLLIVEDYNEERCQKKCITDHYDPYLANACCKETMSG